MISRNCSLAMLLLVALFVVTGNGYALSPPSEIVTDPSSTQLTTLVPNAQNTQQSDVLAALNTETARIAREITAEPTPATTEAGGAIPPRRREREVAARITVKPVAAGESGLSVAAAAQLNQLRERLADVHQALAADAEFAARPEAAGVLASLVAGAQGPLSKILEASRALLGLVRTPGALSDALRAKVDETLAALGPQIRSLELLVAEDTN